MNTTRNIRAEDLMEGDRLPNGHIVTLIGWSIDAHSVETVNVATQDGTDVHATVYAAKTIVEVVK